MRIVEVANWHETFAELAGDGCTFFDFLTVVDRDDQCELVARVMNPETKVAHLCSTWCPEPVAQSISDILPGAGWHEREAAEMFGFQFIGLRDDRQLLLRSNLGKPPLLKSSVLVARAVRDWPGAAGSEDDGRQGGNPSRRRTLPPGVPPGFVRFGPVDKGEEQ